MLDCTGCWNHEKCESRKKKDLVYCFRKNFICRYCGNTDCKNYNTDRRCICFDLVGCWKES